MNRTLRSKSREKRPTHSPGLIDKKGINNTISFDEMASSSCKSSNSGINLMQNIKFPNCSLNIREIGTLHPQMKNDQVVRKISIPINSAVSLAHIKNLTLPSSLFVIIKVLNTYINSQTSGRPFHFSLSACFITYDQKLKVQSDKINRSEKQIDEAATVEIVIKSVEKICGDDKFQDFLMFFKRTQSKFRCNFKYTISLIKSYCSCSKIELKSTIEYMPEKKKNLRSFNNSVKFCSLRISRSSNAKAKVLEQMIKYIQQSKSQEKQSTKRQRNHSGDIVSQKKVALLNKNLLRSNRASKKLHVDEINKFSKATKQSQASTDFKASTFHSEFKNECVQSFTFNSNNSKVPSPGASFVPSSIKTPINNSVDLVEVQSQQESSQNEKEVKNDYEYKNEAKKLFEQNKWIRKYQNLFEGGNNKMMQSIIEGKEQYIQCKTNPQNLGRLARVVVESYMPQGNSKNCTPRLGR